MVLLSARCRTLLVPAAFKMIRSRHRRGSSLLPRTRLAPSSHREREGERQRQSDKEGGSDGGSEEEGCRERAGEGVRKSMHAMRAR